MKRLLLILFVIVFIGCGKDSIPKPTTTIDNTVKDSIIAPLPPSNKPDSVTIVPDTLATPPIIITPPGTALPETPAEQPAPGNTTIPPGQPAAPGETNPAPPVTPPITITFKAWFFGDSITEGYDGKSVNAKNWAALLSQALGWEGHNLGIGGSTLEKNVNGLTVAKNMYNRITEIPFKTEADKYLFFAYGMNDVGFNFFDLTPSQFAADYQYVLDAARDKGWQSRDIVIVNIYYCNQAALFKYSDPLGTASGRMALFNATIKNIAERNGMHFIDVNSYMISNGADLLVAGDGVHPNETGYAVIAHGIEEGIRGFQ